MGSGWLRYRYEKWSSLVATTIKIHSYHCLKKNFQSITNTLALLTTGTLLRTSAIDLQAYERMTQTLPVNFLGAAR